MLYIRDCAGQSDVHPRQMTDFTPERIRVLKISPVHFAE